MSIEQVSKLKELVGRRVRLVSMDDVSAPPSGTEGTVDSVDDIGTVHVKWDDGHHLGLIPEIDRWEVLP